MSAYDRKYGPDLGDDVPRIGWGLIAWIVPSIIGIVLLEAPGVPLLANQSAQLVVLALSVIVYAITYRLARGASRNPLSPPCRTRRTAREIRRAACRHPDPPARRDSESNYVYTLGALDQGATERRWPWVVIHSTIR
ncbi:hypothetical protein DW322_02770 [Rhodococcus rhodnii]|uniref:Uncharacterized protein n=2 Tax=Rhodococcus rhodnii TaxID=38312 RepID=R7WQT2_9NOCA|nr:hypothetical protein Rrhod_0917 [Rhodococcus rhodnii LMG 5362]TXG89360.1 hypothetical protein DW322_02770 [Rhodococcus rhodnii]